MPVGMDINKENESSTLNFICPVCKKEITESEADDSTFDGEGQFYHISCLKKEQDDRIRFEKKDE